MDIEQNLKYSLLLDIYSPLLTDKQVVMLKEYLDNNLGLSEIAGNFNSSRQAVRDIVERTKSSLDSYEDKLSLLSKFNEIKAKITQILQILDKNQEIFTKNQDLSSIRRELENILEVL